MFSCLNNRDLLRLPIGRCKNQFAGSGKATDIWILLEVNGQLVPLVTMEESAVVGAASLYNSLQHWIISNKEG